MVRTAIQRVAALLLIIALAGCSYISSPELGALTSNIAREKIDFPELVAAAHRVQTAHLPEEEIRKIFPDTIAIVELPKVGIRYFITQNPTLGTQYVSLPGSANLKNWLENFEAFESFDKQSGIQLHRGFELVAQAVYADLKPRLDPNRKIQISGHSLGGAVATILTIYLQQDGFKLSRTITFGQPRITNTLGASRYADLPLIRVVDASDPVPRLPLRPFEHFGSELILIEGKKYVFLPSLDANILSKGELFRTLGALSAADHTLELYLNRLTQKLSAPQAVAFAELDEF